MKKNLLSIAGVDPTAGAGIFLDLKVFQNLGFHGIGLVTSVTSQNTQCVKQIHCLPPEFLWSQYQTLHEDIEISGIKVGMLGCQSNIQPIERILATNSGIPVVVDPVFKSSSGMWLLERKAIPEFMEKVSIYAFILTPNLEEASLILGKKVENLKQMKGAAEKIYTTYHIPCLLTGGHLKENPTDLLYNGKDFLCFKNEKVDKKVHGTGCFLSSALLCFLVKGLSIEKAAFAANQLTNKAIINASPTGHGQQVITFPLEHQS